MAATEIGGYTMVGGLRGVDEVLGLVEGLVARAGGDEFVVAADADDAAFVENDDLVGACDGGEAVSDDEGGAALRDFLHGFLDFAFGIGVDLAGGFVEDQDGRIAKDGAGDGNTLALAAGE